MDESIIINFGSITGLKHVIDKRTHTYTHIESNRRNNTAASCYRQAVRISNRAHLETYTITKRKHRNGRPLNASGRGRTRNDYTDVLQFSRGARVFILFIGRPELFIVSGAISRSRRQEK